MSVHPYPHVERGPPFAKEKEKQQEQAKAKSGERGSWYGTQCEG